MVEAIWMQVSLFPWQVWQFLQMLAQRVLAVAIAVLLPLGIWLGLTAPLNRRQPTELPYQPLTDLLYAALPEPYEEVPRPEATDRRGAMAERRDAAEEAWHEAVR